MIEHASIIERFKNVSRVCSKDGTIGSCYLVSKFVFRNTWWCAHIPHELHPEIQVIFTPQCPEEIGCIWQCWTAVPFNFRHPFIEKLDVADITWYNRWINKTHCLIPNCGLLFIIYYLSAQEKNATAYPNIAKSHFCKRLQRPGKMQWWLFGLLSVKKATLLVLVMLVAYMPFGTVSYDQRHIGWHKLCYHPQNIGELQF
jgi:hypothetical protein